ncbi:MAG: PIN domain-containing protein [Deltaproteobacteria bacterium]|nr:PIN domain-containing protein [Deltaproteobacteria bacterium]
MSVLVDTSIWIEYFRNRNNLEKLDFLIDENLIVANDLILAELIPFLKIRNQQKLIKLLHKINKLEIVVNWSQLIDYQYKCIKNGINGIGIPDLIIAQNAKQNHCSIYSLDNHFNRMKNILNIKLV